MSDEMQDVTPSAPEQAPSASPEASAPAADPLMARFDELQSQISALSNPQPAEPEYEHGLSDYAYQQPQWQQDGEPEPEQGYEDPDTQALAQLQSFIAQQVQQGVQQAVMPMQIQQKAEQLEQKYPELQRPEVAGPLVRQAEQYAQRIGFSTGLSPAQVAALGRSPELIETLFLAERARQKAAQETPADGSQGVQLEGSAAQADVPEMSLQDRVLRAGPQRSSFGWM